VSNPVSPAIQWTGVAGQVLEQATTADAILGFGKVTHLKQMREAPYQFEARQGDRLVLHMDNRMDSSLYFDTNADGKPSEDNDEVIIRDLRADALVPDRGMTIVLPHDGTYFLTDFAGTLALLTHRWPAQGGKVSIPVPTQAGTYIGVAEKNGQPAPGEVTLTVQAAAPRRVDVKPRSACVRGRSVDVDFQALDAFDNPAAADVEATVALRGMEQKVQMLQGKGRVRVQCPDEEGDFTVTARTPLGLDRGSVKVRAGGKVEVESVSVSPAGVTAHLVNLSKAELTVQVHANPASYLVGGMENFFDFEEGPDQEPFYWKGYKKGYLPLSAHSKVTLKPGEERDVVLSFGTDKLDVDATKLPYLVVAVDDAMNVLSDRDTEAVPVSSQDGRQKPGGAPVSAIKEAVLNTPLAMDAEGLISVQLNDDFPLFFRPTGKFSLIPDAAGMLTVRIGDRPYKINVKEGSVRTAIPTPPDIPRPDKVQGLQAVSEKDGVRLKWKAPDSPEIDHYVIYRVGRNVKKEAETREAQYLLKADLWNSYTVRVTAVDKKGVESKPSDPCGIVHMPIGM
jgi:translation initiation factor IF-1